MKKKVVKVLFFILFLTLIVLFLIFLFKLCEHEKVEKQFKKVNKIISNSRDIKSVDYYKKFYNNSDIIAIISIANNDTIVTKTTNNSYYLNHLLDRSYNILGNPFLDYRNKITDKKIIIYGHNAKNYNPPFKILEKYLDYNFYKKNKIINLKTNEKIIQYEIFTVSIYKNNYIYYDLDIIDYKKHYNSLKKKSLYDTNVSLTSNDDIIILQTCSNDSNSTYIVIGGKKVYEKMIGSD